MKVFLFSLLFSYWAIAQNIVVTDSKGTPLAGAEILIGHAMDEPFIGNFLQTDENGVAALPENWEEQELPITVDAPGYVRATFFGQLPEDLQFSLSKRELQNRIEMNGRTTGFGQLRTDGYVDFGLVIPGLKKEDIMTFDMSRVISTETDRIRVAGQNIDLPSNLTLPRQRENYIIGITLDKPRYRTFFTNAGTNKVYSLRGRFNFRDVVGKLRGGAPFIEIINDIEFVSGSHQNVDLTPGQRETRNLPVNRITMGRKKTVRAPSFHRSNIMMAVTMADVDGYLFPTDLKTIEGGKSASLKTANIGDKFLLKAVQPKSNFSDENAVDRPLTAIFDRLDSGKNRQLVNFVGQPSQSGNSLQLDAPNANGATSEMGTIVTLSTVKVKDTGDFKVETKRRNWELYANNWQTALDLPIWPGSFSPMNRELRRVEVAFLGSDDPDIAAGPGMIQKATHVIYNKRDY